MWRWGSVLVRMLPHHVKIIKDTHVICKKNKALNTKKETGDPCYLHNILTWFTWEPPSLKTNLCPGGHFISDMIH